MSKKSVGKSTSVSRLKQQTSGGASPVSGSMRCTSTGSVARRTTSVATLPTNASRTRLWLREPIITTEAPCSRAASRISTAGLPAMAATFTVKPSVSSVLAAAARRSRCRSMSATAPKTG